MLGVDSLTEWRKIFVGAHWNNSFSMNVIPLSGGSAAFKRHLSLRPSVLFPLSTLKAVSFKKRTGGSVAKPS